MTFRSIVLVLAGLAALLHSNVSFASEKNVPTTWRLLDYIAVDYREAVREGEVVNEVEYAEMKEFSATAAEAIGQLPAKAESAQLKQDATALQGAIQAKAAPEQIAEQARALAALLVKAYPIPLLPMQSPNYGRGKVLYAQLCAACHGPSGAGDGPAGAGLDPPPIDFTDRARAEERSVFALYQVIDQGLEGTSMVSYASLPVEDRWALATYVGAMAYPEDQVDAGKKLIEGDAALRAKLNFDAYVSTTPAALGTTVGSAEQASAIVAYLRRHPDASQAQDVSSALATSRKLLEEAMTAYRAGQPTQAKDLALSAYLDGFEPVEPLLAARDNALMVKIEAAMARVRSGIAANVAADELQGQVTALDDLFALAEQVLDQGQTSAVASFVAAFTILLREGLEALLIVIWTGQSSVDTQLPLCA